jgi:hypothetical protein
MVMWEDCTVPDTEQGPPPTVGVEETKEGDTSGSRRWAAAGGCDGTCSGTEVLSSAGVKTKRCSRVGDVKADLNIHLPDCRDHADIGMTVALVLAQLMRGKRLPMEVSAMGELNVDGRLFPMQGPGEVLRSGIAQKVITVQYEVGTLKKHHTSAHTYLICFTTLLSHTMLCVLFVSGRRGLQYAQGTR